MHPDLSTTPIWVSLLRVVASLAIVFGVFLGGLWLFRNWQRLVIQKGARPKLQVIETRALGGRHALYVVAYEDQRLLLSASPSGVSLLTHLPPDSTPSPVSDPQLSALNSQCFAEILRRLRGRSVKQRATA